MGAHAQAQAGAVECLQLFGSECVQVFLAQMDAVGACIDRIPPVVVDEQQRARALHCLDGGLDFGPDGAGVVRFEAQLHRGHSGARHAAHPLGVRQHGIQAQALGARGKLLGARKALQAKVLGFVGPLLGLCAAGAQRARLPGAGQAFGVVGNETQLAAGLQRGQVHRVLRRGCGHGLGRKPCKGGRVVTQDGVRQGRGVVGVMHGRGARKGCPARGCWAGRRLVRPWHRPGGLRARH